MKRKKRNTEPLDSTTVEPELEETTLQQKPKMVRWWQILLASLAGLVLLLSLTVALWWTIAGVKSFDEGWKMVVQLFVPRENNVYYRDSYSVDEDKAAKKREKVVATIGEHKLTNGVLQVYYWMNVYDFLENYGYYAIYMGMDYSKPLDEQNHPQEEGTWQHFFLDEALDGWHAYKAMSLMAQKEGIELSQEMKDSLEGLRQNLATSAVNNGFTSIDAMLQKDLGPGCTFEDYYEYTKTYYEGYMYYSTMYNKIDTSMEAIETYFAAHEAELKEQGITKESGNNYDVRHILIEIEGGTKGEDGKTTYSDADWEACRVKAQKLLDEWLAGEHTEETFAEFAKEHSADGGSNTKGGLYTGLDKNTSFVKEFVDWYMAEDRKVGDYGLIKTDYGYHIMYCSAIEGKWVEECRQGLLTDAYAEILEAAMKEYPMDVNYKKIVLGVVNMSN